MPVAAVIVPKESVTLDEEAFVAHCRKHLAGFKVPKRVLVRDSLPRNPSGKILRRILRDEFA